ncbi:MAG: type VII secretion protein EssC [Clostridia bacterium]|nr:type VII secretion protein EssC [Clostridia bacterium]
MILTLLKSEQIQTLVLPEKVNGQFWLRDTAASGEVYDLISVEGVEDKWWIKSNPNAEIFDSQERTAARIAIEPLHFYSIRIHGYPQKAVLFAEPVTGDRNQFQKYTVLDNTRLSIGRLKSNDIVFDNSVVSSQHAFLSFENGSWRLADNNSRNGTFVNGRGINGNTPLKLGDVVYVMGLKIIIGVGFISVNNPDGQVSILSDRIFPFQRMATDYAIDPDGQDGQINESYFYRAPRFKRDIVCREFKVDSPPSNQNGNETPMVLLIGPSATMGMAAMTTGVFAINNAMASGNIKSAIPSAVMSLSMVLGTVLWPVISRSYEKRKRKKSEAVRQKKYTEYLKGLEQEFSDECSKQSAILKENNITIEECISRIQLVSTQLWERAVSHNDFLTLKLGSGDIPMVGHINYQEKRFHLEEDNLEDDMYALCESPKILHDVPITYSLIENRVTGIYGNPQLTKSFVKGLVLQLATLYSYDEVKFIFLYEDEDFSFVKWLPHIWDDAKDFRFIATNNTELKELSAYLDKIISNRLNMSDDALKEELPHYIVFSLSRKLSIKNESVRNLLSLHKDINISVISLSEDRNLLPKECSVTIEVAGDQCSIYNTKNTSGKPVPFRNDISIDSDLRPLAVKLANIQLDNAAELHALPTMISFLDLFGVGKVEHLNPLSRWKDNDPTKSLQAAVGVNSYGDIFYLDLHEKFHGPHGLIAGMTGSGKSEFIITYILSLAINYSPEEVAFILIDYKGGGMAKAFENLPHTAGIITNLDGSAIKRSLISIKSELNRRQEIFSKAGKKLGVSNIDIYKYQKAYRNGSVDEPLPHLFIISDEFAELKTQQQEFMTQLVSAARIGRSLGVHLVLATQKPAGVVDDQIWSNSRFRVCLKVQERADSMDMLKRPDAAELSDTGRFYLQVGYNELFEIGQSAWAGAPYIPSESFSKKEEKEVLIIDNNGHAVQGARLQTGRSNIVNPMKQLDAITGYISKIASSENLRVRPLWQEPLPPVILLSDLREKYHVHSDTFILDPVVGEYDIPENQARDLLTVPITQNGNAVVYGTAGSGKTTFISTMIFDLITTHTAESLNIYILDFGAETLRIFEKAPQVGDVVFAADTEKTFNLFKLLRNEIASRKKLFVEYGGELRLFNLQSETKAPNILVFINNFAAFLETNDNLEDEVFYLTREGAKYGINFVISATGTNAVRYKLLQNFGQTFVLQMNDNMDYTGILGNTNGVFPDRIKGRGVFKEEAVFEFQTAHCAAPAQVFDTVRDVCDRISQTAVNFAKPVPVLPDKVDTRFFAGHHNLLEATPVGVNRSSLEVITLDLKNNLLTVVSSMDEVCISRFSEGLSEILGMNPNVSVTAYDFDSVFSSSGSRSYDYINSDAEEEIVRLFNFMLDRHNELKDNPKKQFTHRVCIFPSFTSLTRILSADGKDKLDVILDKCVPAYAMSFIVCDASSNLRDLSVRSWYTGKNGNGDGIWIGDGISDQYQFRITKMGGDLYKELGGEFGVIIKNGKYKIAKLIQPESGQAEEY